MNTIAIGKRAEQAAAVYLQKYGLRMTAENYRCRRGEIDLIAEDNGVLVFVEVRRRRQLDDAAESICPHKQRRLTAAAAHYLAAFGERPCRFDAVLIDDKGHLRWIKQAFDAQYGDN